MPTMAGRETAAGSGGLQRTDGSDADEPAVADLPVDVGATPMTTGTVSVVRGRGGRTSSRRTPGVAYRETTIRKRNCTPLIADSRGVRWNRRPRLHSGRTAALCGDWLLVSAGFPDRTRSVTGSVEVELQP